MYEWRKLTTKQCEKLLASRQKNHRPWHSPPHFESDTPQCFHLSAACYEHSPFIGGTSSRMGAFESKLIEVLSGGDRILHAWCLLPNHWHALVRTDALKELVREIGKMHGRASFHWNDEDGARGRTCWHRCADRRIRSDRHFYVAMNYIHHNPVKHGYAERWEQWPFSSAADYLAQVGRDDVLRQWQKYPVLEMGKEWDD